MTDAGIPMGEVPCLCCCRPKSQHLKRDLQCPETTYFLANEVADTPPPAAAGDRSVCANCGGSGWVCENHPDRPWEGMSAPGEGCDCGAGSSCPCCNLRMAAAGLTEPLRELVVRAISMLESAERETSWGDPGYGPTPSEVIQNDLDALLNALRTPEPNSGGEDLGQWVRASDPAPMGIGREVDVAIREALSTSTTLVDPRLPAAPTAKDGS